jgi:hypothetical protein
MRTRLAIFASRVRFAGFSRAGPSVAADAALGSLSRRTTIPQDDRSKGSDRRCDREERGQRICIQLTDASRWERLGLIAATASPTADTRARCAPGSAITAAPDTAPTTRTTGPTGTASADSTPSATGSTSTASRSGWSGGLRGGLWGCLWSRLRRLCHVILARRRGNGGRALRDGALVRVGHGDGSGALRDGAFVTVCFGECRSSLDSCRTASGHRLGRRPAHGPR